MSGTGGTPKVLTFEEWWDKCRPMGAGGYLKGVFQKAYEAGYEAGLAKGQAAMRERAVRECEGRCCPLFRCHRNTARTCAAAIRQLEIE